MARMFRLGAYKWMRAVSLAWITLVSVASGQARADALLDAMREGGHILLIRHAVTVPGTGDPPGFTLGRCETQRNLSEQGRDQARLLGERLRAAAVPIDQVRSSAWCRCEETARLAFGDVVEIWAPLNSFFAGQGDRVAQTREALAALTEPPRGGNWVWVTHQVNISALTNTFAAMGEVIVTRPSADGKLEVVGRWRP